MVVAKKTDILLESGTNELGVLEFTIANKHFGINVAKISTIMQYSADIVSMPNSNPYVEGVFKPREQIMTVLNLPLYLGLPESEHPERDILLITHFNKINTAFHVHGVEVIHRISWEQIEKPDRTIYGGTDALATGIARIDGRLITIVDFEKIVSDICPELGIQVDEVDEIEYRDRSDKTIMIAEDSVFLEKLLIESLQRSGYNKLIRCSNGKEAWEKLEEFSKTGQPIEDFVSCVITDIEMPHMDGHHLTKRIRLDSKLSKLPVIIFSSLISEKMMEKGEKLGASAQITKPEIGNLVRLVDNCILA